MRITRSNTRYGTYNFSGPYQTLFTDGNRGDMSAAELELLTEEHKTKPLPVGWFFDGSIFIDYEGNRRRERPGMCQS